MKLALALAAVLFATQARADSDPTTPPIPPRPQLTQRHCYCWKRMTGNQLQQYRIMSMPSDPACRDVSFRTTQPYPWWEVLSCDYLAACIRAKAQGEARLRTLTAAIGRETNPTRLTALTNQMTALTTWMQNVERQCFQRPLRSGS